MTDAEARDGREPEDADDDPSEDDYDEDGESGLPWQWIAAAAVGLAALGGLYFGLQHYHARRDTAAAERLMAEGRNAEAIEVLDRTLQRSPDSTRAVLLKMKAEFLRGNWPAAGELAPRLAGKTMKGDLVAEVNTIKQRVDAAVGRQMEAGALVDRGELAKAELLLSEAAGLYPESTSIRESLESVQGTLAFEKKDYGRFLEIAEQGAQRRPDSSIAMAMLASALSAQYAASGDAKYREGAEQALDAARRLSEGVPPARAAYGEYSERIRHRLQTREIIGRAEYDRRFRGASAAKPQAR